MLVSKNLSQYSQEGSLMKLRVIVGLWMLASIGCNEIQEVGEETRKASEQDNLQQIALASPQDGTADLQPKIVFDRRIATATEYYTTGPQQGRAPDGMFPVGTRVRLLEEAGSYTLVEAEDGITAYVTADAIHDELTPPTGVR
jgi:hypothetical protein